MKRRPNDKGVALLNVLIVLAIGAGLVQGMLKAQSTAIYRTAQAADRAQARALAWGGVASLRTGLRRDMFNAPDSDHLSEPWAKAAQTLVSFDFGSFSAEISDAQSRLNLNALRPDALAHLRAFAALLNALDLPKNLGPRIIAIVRQNGPLTSLVPLRLGGIDQRIIDSLGPYVTILPKGVLVNLNTATEPVLTALFSNAVAARGLVAKRSAKGFLNQADLATLGLVQPLLAGWQSNIYDVTITATVGSVTQSLRRRIWRDRDSGTVTDTAWQ